MPGRHLPWQEVNEPLMTDAATSDTRTGRVSKGGVAAAVLGVALFVYYLPRVGVGDIVDSIGRLGWVFLIVVALQGLRFAVRGMAWRACLEGTHRLTPGRAFQAVVAGDTLGNLPLLSLFSLLVSEPAKALLVRDREPVSRTLAALAVENLFYTLSAALVITGGALMLMLRPDTTETWWLAGGWLFAALILLISLTHAVIWRQVRVASRLFDLVARWELGSPQLVARWGQRVRRVEDGLYALYPREPGRLVQLTCWELSFHTLAVLEIYIVLSRMSDVIPTLADSFILESANRFVTSAFKVVPMRIGVDEWSTATVAELLGFGTAAGFALAIVRKARMLVWMTVGVGLLARQGLSVRGAIDAAGAARRARQNESTSRATRGPAVVVMARSPEGTRPPKTRLGSVLPDEQDRRRLYAAFLADVVTGCRSIDGVTMRLAYTGDGGTGGFDTAGVADDQLLPQRGVDLGDRERGVFEDLFRDGFSPVVLVGSDLPTLPAERVVEALDRLRGPGDRVVLGPANDGGYYLIGLEARTGDQAVPDLFTDVRWSTEWARADTVAAADRCGLAVELLGDWYDIDDEKGLRRLRAELATEAGARRAPATTRVLREILADSSGDRLTATS